MLLGRLGLSAGLATALTVFACAGVGWAEDKSVAGEAVQQLRIATTREPALIGPLLRLFEGLTRTPIDITYVSGEPVEALRAESAKVPLDVFISSEVSQLIAAKAAGLTVPVTDAEVLGLVPARFRDPEAHWLGLSRRMRIVVAAADRVTVRDLTYEALSQPEWKGRVCTRSGLHPYNVSLTAAMLARNGAEKTEAWLAGVKGNLARSPKGGDRDQIRAVLDGQCDVALVNTYYAAGVLKGKAGAAAEAPRRLAVIFPNRADHGSHVSVSGMALMKGGAQAKKAMLAMDFLLSKPAQYVYAQDNFEFPLRSDVAADKLAAVLGEPSEDQIEVARWASLLGPAAELVRKVGFDAAAAGGKSGN
jgi:iron(III) transport system substrate-binding protein